MRGIGVRGSVGVVVVAALVVGLAGCAVPDGSEAHPVDSDIAGLLSPQATPSPVETLPPRPVSVTWVRGNMLDRVGRFVPASSRSELLKAALFELEVGPRPTEQRQGYRTLLPVDLVIEGELRRTRASIDLKLTTPTETGGVALAVGQIAVTALAVPHVRSVVFSVNGRRTKVEVPGRQRGVGVVRERDYRGVLK